MEAMQYKALLDVNLIFVFENIVLHKYGCLLGLWKLHVNPYGGLVQIKVGDELMHGHGFTLHGALRIPLASLSRVSISYIGHSVTPYTCKTCQL